MKKSKREKLYHFMLVGPGGHTEDGVRYKKGQIVKSDMRLDEIFKNKFELIRTNELAVENSKELIDVPEPKTDDVDGNEDGDEDEGEPIVTFEVKKVGKGKYNVLKMIDSESVQEMNEDEYITTKKKADALAKKYQKDWEKKMKQAKG